MIFKKSAGACVTILLNIIMSKMTNIYTYINQENGIFPFTRFLMWLQFAFLLVTGSLFIPNEAFITKKTVYIPIWIHCIFTAEYKNFRVFRYVFHDEFVSGIIHLFHKTNCTPHKRSHIGNSFFLLSFLFWGSTITCGEGMIKNWTGFLEYRHNIS